SHWRSTPTRARITRCPTPRCRGSSIAAEAAPSPRRGLRALRSNAPEPRRARRRTGDGAKDGRADDVGPPGWYRTRTGVLRWSGLYVGTRARGTRGPRRRTDGGFDRRLLLARRLRDLLVGRSQGADSGRLDDAVAARTALRPARTRARLSSHRGVARRIVGAAERCLRTPRAATRRPRKAAPPRRATTASAGVEAGPVPALQP